LFLSIIKLAKKLFRQILFSISVELEKQQSNKRIN